MFWYLNNTLTIKHNTILNAIMVISSYYVLGTEKER